MAMYSDFFPLNMVIFHTQMVSNVPSLDADPFQQKFLQTDAFFWNRTALDVVTLCWKLQMEKVGDWNLEG